MSLSTSIPRAIRRLTYFAAAATLVFVGAAVPVQAAPDPRPAVSLPAPGESFDLDVSSDGLQFSIGGELLTSAPLRGTLTVNVAANPADPKALSVEATPADLRLTTKAAQTHAITVEQLDTAVDETSVLRLVKPRPAKFKHVMALNLRFTITMAAAEADRTVELATARPALVKSSLKGFPPRNAPYSLAKPVALTPVGESAPGAEATTLSGFDVIVNQM